MPVVSALLNWHPHLQALSASSPIWAGHDTGYASNRAMMFQQLPTAGLPFQFEDWSQFESYAEDLLTTGVIDEVDEIRWDVRPAPQDRHRRSPDLRRRLHLWEMRALVALTHCLVVDLCDRLRWRDAADDAAVARAGEQMAGGSVRPGRLDHPGLRLERATAPR